MNLSPTLYARLQKLAAEYEPTEHDDLFGENPDAAYEMGVRDGEGSLATEIIAELAKTQD